MEWMKNREKIRIKKRTYLKSKQRWFQKK
jgi:hypothetical protein